ERGAVEHRAEKERAAGPAVFGPVAPETAEAGGDLVVAGPGKDVLQRQRKGEDGRSEQEGGPARERHTAIPQGGHRERQRRPPDQVARAEAGPHRTLGPE